MYELFELSNCEAENGLKLLYVTCFRSERPWHGIRHSHDFLEIFFCVGGQCEFWVRDRSFSLLSRQFVIISPGVEHTECTVPSASVEWIVLGIKGCDITLPNTAYGYFVADFKDNHSETVSLLVNLVHELQNKAPRYKEACLSILHLLIIYVGRSFDTSITIGKNSNTSPHSSISWVKQYIDDNYTSSLNLEMLSNKVGLNRYSLIREFKRLYQISPIEYMLQCRYREAKFLLETTDRNISNIGQDLGFCSGNYFSQCFQRRFGISPTAYRKSHRDGEKRNHESTP